MLIPVCKMKWPILEMQKIEKLCDVESQKKICLCRVTYFLKKVSDGSNDRMIDPTLVKMELERILKRWLRIQLSA